MGIVKNGDMSPRCGASDREVSFKEKAPVEKGIGQRQRIGMNGRDEIGPGSEVLRAANPDDEIDARKYNNTAQTCAQESHRPEA